MGNLQFAAKYLNLFVVYKDSAGYITLQSSSCKEGYDDMTL